MSVGLQKTLVVSVTLILLLGVSYYIWISQVEVPPVVVSQTLSEVAGQDIVILSERLKAVSFDNSFFSSNLFNGLQDYTAIISPEAVGRTNPFAPIGQ